MQFTNDFFVPTDNDTTFRTLTDLERVAPCMPGATLEEVDGDSYTGRVTVRVGPMQMAYKGTARVAETDFEAKRVRIEATGRETRGSGSAKADVVATLVEEGNGTLVKVVTELDITGKPAQFGSGVLADVGSKIISTFAERLRDMLEKDKEGARAEAAAPSEAEVHTGMVDTGPRRIQQRPGQENEPLNLVEVAGAATLKRLAPIALGVAVIALIWWLVRR